MQADKIRFEGGGFNLDVLRGALGSLPAVDEAFSAAQQKVDGIDRSALLPLVDDAIGQVLDVIADTAPLVHSATEVLPTALQMLGDTEPRTYFVIFQNNAEIRATGGNPAASVLLHVEDGRVSLGRTGQLDDVRVQRTRRSPVRRPAGRDPGAVLPGLPAVLAELHQDPELPHDRRAVPGNPRRRPGRRSTVSSRSIPWRSRTCSRSPGR